MAQKINKKFSTRYNKVKLKLISYAVISNIDKNSINK